jgi:hypothetical protein
LYYFIRGFGDRWHPAAAAHVSWRCQWRQQVFRTLRYSTERVVCSNAPKVLHHNAWFYFTVLIHVVRRQLVDLIKRAAGKLSLPSFSW